MTAWRTRIALGTAMLCGLACSESGPPATAGCEGCSVLIVVLDAARADHFGCYGYGRDTTPRVDALAREAVLFEQASSNASFTIASVASLLTGLPPARHGVLQSGSQLAPEAATLAEALAEAGYRTAAFTENPLIDADYGYAQGFDRFRAFFPRRAGMRGGRDLDLSGSPGHVDEMLAWLDEDRGDRPFLLYAHLLRPHNPYHPLPEHSGRFSAVQHERVHREGGGNGPDHVDGSTRQLRELNIAGASDEELRRLVDLYDENLLSADALVGRLLDGLRGRGLLARTLVAIVSDHGEAFAEHGRLLHGIHVYQEDVHVPFLLRFPQALGIAPRREGTPVQLSDLMPTVLSALAVESVVPGAGRDLMPLLRGGGPARAAPIVSHAALAVSLNEAGLKLVSATRPDAGGPERRLFDLAADPGETRDLAAVRSADAERLHDRLRAALAEQRAEGLPSAERALDAERLERLRALGYVDEAP